MDPKPLTPDLGTVVKKTNPKSLNRVATISIYIVYKALIFFCIIGYPFESKLATGYLPGKKEYPLYQDKVKNHNPMFYLLINQMK